VIGTLIKISIGTTLSVITKLYLCSTSTIKFVFRVITLKSIFVSKHDIKGDDNIVKKCNRLFENTLDTKQLSLVLDLDETLVHSSTKQPENEHEMVILSSEDGTTKKVYVQKRPNLKEFLQKVSTEYNVIIYTASKNIYADAVIDLIDEELNVRERYYRTSCIKT